MMQIESNLTIATRLSVEGPLRMKEEYMEGTFASPKVNEESIPPQLRDALGQAATTMEQLPVPIKDAVSGGLKVPLGEYFKLIYCFCILLFFKLKNVIHVKHDHVTKSKFRHTHIGHH